MIAPKSLGGRLALAGMAATLLATLLAFVVLERATRQSALAVADARLLELLGELRGVWATTVITGDIPTVAGDLELLWQIEDPQGAMIRSEWLIQNAARLPTTAAGAEPAFANVETTQGTLRLVSRQLREMLPKPPESGVSEYRDVTYWAAMTADRRRLLTDNVIQPLRAASRWVMFGFVGLIAVSLLLIALVLRRPLDRLQREAAAFARGDTARLSEDYPSELQLVTTHLNRATDRQTAAAEQTRRYINKIVHDLKTPIAVVHDAIGDPTQSDLARRRLMAMGQALERYSTLANIVGPALPQPSRPLAPMLREAVDAMALLYRKTPWRIDLQVDPALKARVAPQDIDIIVSNLLSNAHKHAHSQARLAVEREAGQLILSCADDGPGLAPGAFEQALGWGVRLDERPAGSGFGLAILRDFATLYHGKIRRFETPLGGLGIAISLNVDGLEDSEP